MPAEAIERPSLVLVLCMIYAFACVNPEGVGEKTALLYLQTVAGKASESKSQ